MVEWQIRMCCMVDAAHRHVVCSSFTPPPDNALPPGCSAYWKGYLEGGGVVNSKTPMEVAGLSEARLNYWQGVEGTLRAEERRRWRQQGLPYCQCRDADTEADLLAALAPNPETTGQVEAANAEEPVAAEGPFIAGPSREELLQLLRQQMEGETIATITPTAIENRNTMIGEPPFLGELYRAEQDAIDRAARLNYWQGVEGTLRQQREGGTIAAITPTAIENRNTMIGEPPFLGEIYRAEQEAIDRAARERLYDEILFESASRDRLHELERRAVFFRELEEQAPTIPEQLGQPEPTSQTEITSQAEPTPQAEPTSQAEPTPQVEPTPQAEPPQPRNPYERRF